MPLKIRRGRRRRRPVAYRSPELKAQIKRWKAQRRRRKVTVKGGDDER